MLPIQELLQFIKMGFSDLHLSEKIPLKLLLIPEF